MKKLDRFILREVISDGARGTVYRADEILPGDNRRTVALKVFPEVGGGAVTGETAEEQQFFAEVRALSKLPLHPHVVTIYAIGLTDGRPWVAMEYAPVTLAQRLAGSDAPAEWREVARMIEQVARGLSAMHGLKPPLVHQDLKPGNILLDAAGNYKVTDFTLAAASAENRTQALATVRYAAPELLSGEHGAVGPATDLYALGHIAYEMALGRKLHRQQFPAVFEGNTAKEPPPNKWMMWHASGGLMPPGAADVVKGFPAGLSEIIGRLMSKPLTARYKSAEELLLDLGGAGISERSNAPMAAEASAVRTALPEPKATIAGNQGQSPAQLSAGTSARGHERYWVRLRGKISGPFEMAALQRQAKQGQISRLHQISTDQVTWKAASAVDGLFGPTIV